MTILKLVTILRGDIHIHSKYSYDSVMEPYNILKLCDKFGFDVLSITDHDSIEGSLIAKKHGAEFGIKVLIGEERKTDCGDIIGLNLNEEINSYNWIEVIEEIKNQGGISIFPHPFRGHNKIEKIAQYVDIIETFNSRSSIDENNKALNLALKFNKPSVAGSDAHVYSELGNSIIDCDDFFTYDKNIIANIYSNKLQKVESYLIKDIRLQAYHKVPMHLMRLVL